MEDSEVQHWWVIQVNKENLPSSLDAVDWGYLQYKTYDWKTSDNLQKILAHNLPGINAWYIVVMDKDGHILVQKSPVYQIGKILWGKSVDTALMFVLMRKQDDVNSNNNSAFREIFHDLSINNKEIAKLLKINAKVIASTTQEVVDWWANYIASWKPYRERLASLKNISILDTAKEFLSEWLGLHTKQMQDLIWNINGSWTYEEIDSVNNTKKKWKKDLDHVIKNNRNKKDIDWFDELFDKSQESILDIARREWWPEESWFDSIMNIPDDKFIHFYTLDQLKKFEWDQWLKHCEFYLLECDKFSDLGPKWETKYSKSEADQKLEVIEVLLPRFKQEIAYWLERKLGDLPLFEKITNSICWKSKKRHRGKIAWWLATRLAINALENFLETRKNWYSSDELI